jgi:hypothetical protein
MNVNYEFKDFVKNCISVLGRNLIFISHEDVCNSIEMTTTIDEEKKLLVVVKC